jgi:hypothetical protein
MPRCSAIAGLALVLLLSAACRGGSAPGAGIVWVVNLSDGTGSFQWESPDTDTGRSGTEPITACQMYGRGFDPGNNQITISSGSDRSSFVFVVPPVPASGWLGPVQRWFVIGRDGHVAETTERAAPTPPYCHSN